MDKVFKNFCHFQTDDLYYVCQNHVHLSYSLLISSKSTNHLTLKIELIYTNIKRVFFLYVFNE